MPKVLNQAFFNYYDSLKLKNGWDGLLTKLYKDQTFLYDDFQSVIEECLQMSIASPFDYLQFSKFFFQLIVFREFYPHFKEKTVEDIETLYKRLVRYENYQVGRLSILYKVSIECLLGFKDQKVLETLDFSSSILFQSGYDIEDQYLPKKVFLAEKALILVILGLFFHRPDILQLSLSCCQFLRQFFDQNFCPLSGIWEKEQDFKPIDIFCSHALIFYAAALLTKDHEYEKIYHHLLSEIKDSLCEQNQIQPFYPLVLKLLEKLFVSTSLKTIVPLPLDLSKINDLFGMTLFQSKQMDLILTCSGFYSGFGTLTKKDLKIISMGPHLQPLGNSSGFGIYRIPCLKERAFKEIKKVNSREQKYFSAWARVVGNNKNLSDSWFYIKSEMIQDKCCFTFRLEHLKEPKEICVAFFIQAKKASVSKNFHLIPQSLDRYFGAAENVCFFSEKTTLEVYSQGASSMQVIPLVGHNFFWEADFLLAYYLDSEKPLHVEIY